MDIRRKGSKIGMVKKIISFFIAFIAGGFIMFNLSGCHWFNQSFRQSLLSRIPEQEKILYESAEKIVEALNKKDITLLYGILSKSCMEQEDLEKGFSYSCDLLDGKIIDIGECSHYEEDHWDSGKHSCKGNASFTQITTESGKIYHLYFDYWFDNDFDENKIGVERFKIRDADEYDKNTCIDISLYKHSGIYHPEWDEEFK